MSFESEQEGRLRRKSREAQAESRESREGEVDEELKVAAAMERADYLSKEIKSSKKQMQNIILNMQQVKQAIADLRAELQLAAQDSDSSVQQDERNIERIKEKIAGFQEEIVKMRGDLVREQMEELKAGIGVGMMPDQLQQKAESMVDEFIKKSS